MTNENFEAACAHDTDSWFDRRTMLRIGAASAAAAAVVGFGEAVPASAANWSDNLGTLKIGYLPITDASPLLIGKHNGLFADKGIKTDDPTLFRSWPALVEAFSAKKVDIIHILMPLALQLKFAAKQDVKVLTWNHTNGSAITVAKSINTINDLAGKTVAIPHWFSLHNVIIQQAFKTAGLKAIIKGDASAADKTVKLVPAAPADMPVQLAAGQIAGYVVAEPFNALAEVKGIGKILRFSGDIWKDHACCVTLVRGDLVKNNPNAAQAIADVIAQSQLIIENDRNQAATNLSTGGYLPQALPAIKKALADYTVAEYPKAITHPEWNQQRISFHPFPFPSYTVELVKRLKLTAVDADKTFLNDIDPKKVHAQLVAVGFAEKAIKKNGGVLQYGLPKSLTRKEVIS